MRSAATYLFLPDECHWVTTRVVRPGPRADGHHLLHQTLSGNGRPENAWIWHKPSPIAKAQGFGYSAGFFDRLPGGVAAVFQPSKDDVRRFFCEAWARHLGHQPLSPIEILAVDWIHEHPEYHAELADLNAALARDYSVEAGMTNPFLHLSMHLSIEEQVSIDQPPGIRAAFATLAQRLDSRHAAMHAVMECLGEALWKSQREGVPVDGAAYIDSILRRAGR